MNEARSIELLKIIAAAWEHGCPCYHECPEYESCHGEQCNGEWQASVLSEMKTLLDSTNVVNTYSCAYKSNS